MSHTWYVISCFLSLSFVVSIKSIDLIRDRCLSFSVSISCYFRLIRRAKFSKRNCFWRSKIAKVLESNEKIKLTFTLRSTNGKQNKNTLINRLVLHIILDFLFNRSVLWWEMLFFTVKWIRSLPFLNEIIPKTYWHRCIIIVLLWLTQNDLFSFF